MTLSIVIPVYNVEQYVAHCLQSCLNQGVSPEDYEIIVVDDGSKDGSLDIVKNITEGRKNIKVISKENGGLSSARNAGMNVVKGDYIMFLDSDDWISDNCLSKIILRLNDEKPDCMVIKAVEVHGDEVKDSNNYPQSMPNNGPELLKQGVSPCAPFAIWRAQFLKESKLTFYEGIFHEDSEFTPRAYYLAEKVTYYTDVVYNYYCNPNSITQTINPKRAHDLVNVVCYSLSVFSTKVNKEYRQVFDSLVSMYLNNALEYISSAIKEERKKLNEEVYNHNCYLDHLLRSGVNKYIIEGRLIQLFPRHSVEVFRMLGCLRVFFQK